MKDLKPWSQIKVMLITVNEREKIEYEISVIKNLVDINRSQFSVPKLKESGFSISEISNADVVLIESLPFTNEEIKKRIFGFIIKQNIPCWIYNSAFSDFCKYAGLNQIKLQSKSSELTLTTLGRNDPVFSIIPGIFSSSDKAKAQNHFDSKNPLEILAYLDRKFPAALKYPQKTIYATSIPLPDQKELLMQFLREYVGYLEYLA